MADTTPKPSSVAVTQVAYDAGFRGVGLVNAVALALAESNGNPNAVNDNPKTGDYSVGYWQVNYFDKLRPQRTAQFGPPENLHGVDPTGPEAHANGKAAYALSGGGTTWNPWKADFNNGRYYEKLPEAKAAVAQFMGGATAPAAVGSPYQYATSTGVTTAPNADTGAGVSTGTGAATTEQDHCLVQFPGLPIVGGDFCLMSTNKARAMGGALIMVGGGLVFLLGVTLLLNVDKTFAAVAGNVGGKPVGLIAGAVSSKAREERHYKRAERPTPEQRKQGKAAARGTVIDRDGIPF